MASIKYRSSCDLCLSAKIKCTQERPACSRCTERDRCCVYSHYRKIGRPSYKSRLSSLNAKDPKALQIASQRQNALPPPVELPATQYQQALFSGPAPGAISAVPLHNLARGPTGRTRDDESHTNLGTPFDVPVEGNDWTALDSMVNLPIDNIPVVPRMESNTTQAHLGDMADGNKKSPAYSAAFSAAPTRSSWDGQNYLIDQLLAQPLTFSGVATHDHAPTYPDGPFSMPEVSCPGSSAGINTESPFEIALFLQSEFEPSTHYGESSDTGISTRSLSTTAGCILQCYLQLTSQLACINEYQAGGDRLTIDVILSMEGHVQSTWERIVPCHACLAGPWCGQTILLATMVVDSLLATFERGCIQRGSSTPNGDSGRTALARELGDDSKTWFALPMTCHLTVGRKGVDDQVKFAFVKHLSYLYLDRQRKVIEDIEKAVDKIRWESDVSYNVTHQLFADVKKRLECCVGLVALSDQSGVWRHV